MLLIVKRLAVIGLLLVGNIYNLTAQEVSKQIIIGDSLSLNSEILNAEKLFSKLTSFNKSIFLTVGNERDEMVNNAYNHFWENKKYEDAVDALEYFAKEHSKSFVNLAPRFVRAGRTLMENKMYACAIRLYELITDANNKIFGAYKGLGDAYFSLEKKEEALENYKRALELRPNDEYIQKQIKNLTGTV